MRSKKVLLINTGGTITMSGNYDSKEGVNPIYSGKDLLSLLPPFKKKIMVNIHEYGSHPSPHMRFSNMTDLMNIVLNNPDYDGYVITHGTDTLEETAYFLDITIKKNKPIVITAAMRSIGELGLDGPRNLYSSIRVAANDEAYIHKVMVVLNDEIFDAKTVTKTDTSNISSFSGLDMGILGVVDEDKVIFYRKRHYYEYYPVKAINADIFILKTYTGCDSRLIDHICDIKADGIIIEALGRGNVPPDMIPGIKRAAEMEIPLIIVSRAYQGRVLDVYGYSGGGKRLKEIGCIFAGRLSGQKARIKLAVLLSKGVKHKDLQKYFLND